MTIFNEILEHLSRNSKIKCEKLFYFSSIIVIRLLFCRFWKNKHVFGAGHRRFNARHLNIVSWGAAVSTRDVWTSAAWTRDIWTSAVWTREFWTTAIRTLDVWTRDFWMAAVWTPVVWGRDARCLENCHLDTAVSKRGIWAPNFRIPDVWMPAI